MKVQQQTQIQDDCSLDAQDAFEYAMKFSCTNSSPEELIEALKWLIIADAQGHREAATYRIDIVRELSLSQIVKAQRQARLWISKRI